MSRAGSTSLIAGGLDNVRWDLLSDAAKGPKVWAALARMMGPQALRMNLNTLLRHDVFSVEQLSSTVSEAGTNFTSDKRLGQSFYTMVDYVADRIADESEIRRSKQFPYRYFAAYLNANRKFAGIVLVSDNESWVGTGRSGSTGVMTAWEAFVANQRKLAGKEANPKLVCIDLQPNQTAQACERADIMNIGGFSDSVFNVISAFLADNNQRFVADAEAIEL